MLCQSVQNDSSAFTVLIYEEMWHRMLASFFEGWSVERKMIVEIKEYKYMGITLNHVEGKGWKCVLGECEYMFPHAQAAEATIAEIFDDSILSKIAKYNGKKLPKNK